MAKKWAYNVFENINYLELHPKIGRVVPEVNIESLRELIVGNYRLVYQINSSNIEILTIRHSAKPFSEY